MENASVGRVLTEATIENLRDVWECQAGRRPSDQVRCVKVSNALVDTGATTLSLPSRLIHQLGLERRYKKPATSSGGMMEVNVYDAVRLTIQGRDVTVDPVEVPDTVPVLIGQIPLEWLDLVPDPRSRRLVGNPAHGGEQILDLL